MSVIKTPKQTIEQPPPAPEIRTRFFSRGQLGFLFVLIAGLTVYSVFLYEPYVPDPRPCDSYNEVAAEHALELLECEDGQFTIGRDLQQTIEAFRDARQ